MNGALFFFLFFLQHTKWTCYSFAWVWFQKQTRHISHVDFGYQQTIGRPRCFWAGIIRKNMWKSNVKKINNIKIWKWKWKSVLEDLLWSNLVKLHISWAELVGGGKKPRLIHKCNIMYLIILKYRGILWWNIFWRKEKTILLNLNNRNAA